MPRHDQLLLLVEEHLGQLGPLARALLFHHREWPAALGLVRLMHQEVRLLLPQGGVNLTKAIPRVEIAAREQEEHALRPFDVQLERADVLQVVDVEED